MYKPLPRIMIWGGHSTHIFTNNTAAVSPLIGVTLNNLEKHNQLKHKASMLSFQK